MTRQYIPQVTQKLFDQRFGLVYPIQAFEQSITEY